VNELLIDMTVKQETPFRPNLNTKKL